jgi:HK97 family phage portal protein
VTILSSLSNALATADRGLTALRRAADGYSSPMLVPIPANQPVELSGENRVVSYADSVATYPTIFAVWSKLLRNLATTDLGVYEDPGGGKQPKRVYDTSLEELLRRPAPGKGLVDLLQWLFNPYLVEGNGLIAKYRGDGEAKPPTNLIPLDWRYMSAMATPGGPVRFWISYQIGEARVIDPTEVVHLAWHSPNGWTIGTSPLRSLGTAIRIDDAAQRFQNSSFDNAARPSGALVIPKDARTTPEERAEMRAAVEAQHKGIDNAFKIAVLSGGMDWKPMSFSAAEAQLIDTRRAAHDDVCIAYDVKHSVIAEHTGAGTAPKTTVAEILRDFHRSLRPHATLAEQVIQRQLIDPEPEWADANLCVRFDFSDLLRGTYREEVEISVHGYTNGVFSEDEARGRLDLKIQDTPESRVPHVPHAQLQPAPDGRTLPPSTETDPSRETRTTPPAGPAGE